MSIQEENATLPLEETPATQQITEQQVVDYLREHADLFLRNPSLVIQMEIPHQNGDGTISLIEHQVKLLRDQNAQFKHKLMELVNVARDNDRLTDRMMKLTLALMETGDLHTLLQTLEHSLGTEFQADESSIRLFDTTHHLSEQFPEKFVERTDRVMQLFGEFFNSGRPLCGRLRPEQLQFLFAERADRVQSAVIIPLGKGNPFGMIAIGSENRNRFHPGMGTIFLKQMGVLISSMLHRHLETAPDHA